ncbi:Uu.00g045180.m01.CDS01 [Anthostomella pinea]|uniref:Uu.00g045180.m01.CDS01 n=1 Tax=Anthostomella pinea TaxID=933095 RepID=A0AAI8VB45_9PEZI|nr:Uu.00g045180.m01.CDS01 [Anthostomella pinea]
MALTMGSHARYKRDTSIFLTWLNCESSKIGGLIIIGRDPTTTEITNQATTVAAAGTQGECVPAWSQNALRRAVLGRRRCGIWYQAVCPDMVEANATHKYYTGILESCQATLKILATSGATIQNSMAEMAHSSPSAEIENMFLGLTLEEPTELQDEQDTIHGPEDLAIPKEYHINDIGSVDQKRETIFLVFSFFEDIHRSMQTVKALWTETHQDKAAYITALMQTTEVLYAIRRQELDVHSIYTRHFPTKGRPFEELAAALVKSDAPLDADSRTRPQGMGLPPIQKFALLPLGEILGRLCQTKQLGNMFGWPPPILPMRAYNAHQPAILDTPDFIELEKSADFLGKLVLDMILADRVDLEVKLGNPIAKDVFSSALRTIWADGTVTVESVVAAQLLLHLRELQLDDMPSDKGFADYESALDLVKQGDSTGHHPLIPRLKMAVQDSTLVTVKTQVMKEGRGYPAHSSQEAELRKTFKDGKVPAWMLKKLTGFDADVRLILPNPDPCFLFRHNPLLGAVLALDGFTARVIVGIDTANQRMTVFAVAHIYNLLRQQDPKFMPWESMDRVLKLHARELFASAVPEDAKTAYERFSFQTGLASSTVKITSKRQSWLLKPTPAVQIMRQYADGSDSLEVFQRKLSIQLAASVLKRQPKVASGKKEDTTLKAWLDMMKDYITASVQEADLDYFALIGHCDRIVVELEKELEQQLGRSYPGPPASSPDHRYGFMIMILGILKDAKEHERPDRTSEKGKLLQGLLVAQDVIRASVTGV